MPQPSDILKRSQSFHAILPMFPTFILLHYPQPGVLGGNTNTALAGDPKIVRMISAVFAAVDSFALAGSAHQRLGWKAPRLDHATARTYPR